MIEYGLVEIGEWRRGTGRSSGQPRRVNAKWPDFLQWVPDSNYGGWQLQGGTGHTRLRDQKDDLLMKPMNELYPDKFEKLLIGKWSYFLKKNFTTRIYYE